MTEGVTEKETETGGGKWRPRGFNCCLLVEVAGNSLAYDDIGQVGGEMGEWMVKGRTTDKQASKQDEKTTNPKRQETETSETD